MLPVRVCIYMFHSVMVIGLIGRSYRTHVYTHTDVYIYHAQECVYIHTQESIYIYTHTHSRVCVYIHTRRSVYIHIHTHRRVYIHVHTHRRVHIYTHTQESIDIHTHTVVCIYHLVIVIGLIHMCDMKLAHVRHDSFTRET